MATRRDKRTKKWFFRYKVRGRSFYGTPGQGRFAHLPKTKKGAEEAERIARAEQGKPRPREAPTLADFSKTYMALMKTVGNKRGPNKPSTLDAKDSHLRVHLLPALGKRRLDEIDEVAIEDLRLAIGRRKAGGSVKTANNVVGTLHNILRVAKKRKLIATVPDPEWRRVGEQEFDFFDFEEAERLQAGSTKVTDWECAVALALKTGLRLGELRALRWGDVDLVARRVHVRRNLWRDVEGSPKNGHSRVVDLPRSAARALTAHQHIRGERVFLDPSGEDYSIGAWRHGLYRCCRRAKLRVVGWHVLRHTFASHLTMRGESLRVVQTLMGHRTVQMTLRYSHLASGFTQATVDRLDEPAPRCSERAAKSENRN